MLRRCRLSRLADAGAEADFLLEVDCLSPRLLFLHANAKTQARSGHTTTAANRDSAAQLLAQRVRESLEKKEKQPLFSGAGASSIIRVRLRHADARLSAAEFGPEFGAALRQELLQCSGTKAQQWGSRSEPHAGVNVSPGAAEAAAEPVEKGGEEGLLPQEVDCEVLFEPRLAVSRRLAGREEENSSAGFGLGEGDRERQRHRDGHAGPSAFLLNPVGLEDSAREQRTAGAALALCSLLALEHGGGIAALQRRACDVFSVSAALGDGRSPAQEVAGAALATLNGIQKEAASEQDAAAGEETESSDSSTVIVVDRLVDVVAPLSRAYRSDSLVDRMIACATEHRESPYELSGAAHAPVDVCCPVEAAGVLPKKKKQKKKKKAVDTAETAGASGGVVVEAQSLLRGSSVSVFACSSEELPGGPTPPAGVMVSQRDRDALNEFRRKLLDLLRTDPAITGGPNAKAAQKLVQQHEAKLTAVTGKSLQRLLAPFFSVTLEVPQETETVVPSSAAVLRVLQAIEALPFAKHASVIQPLSCVLPLLTQKCESTEEVEVITQTLLACEKGVLLSASYTLLAAQDRDSQLSAARDAFLQVLTESESILKGLSGAADQPVSAVRSRVLGSLLLCSSLLGRALLLALDDDDIFLRRTEAVFVLAAPDSQPGFWISRLRTISSARSRHLDVKTILSRRLLHSLLLDATSSEYSSALIQRCGGSNYVPFVSQLAFVLSYLSHAWAEQQASDTAVADILSLGGCLNEALTFTGRASGCIVAHQESGEDDGASESRPLAVSGKVDSGGSLVGLLSRAAGAAASMTSKVAGKMSEGVGDAASCVQHAVQGKSVIMIYVCDGVTAKEVRVFLEACNAASDERAGQDKAFLAPRLILAAPGLMSATGCLDALRT